MITARDIQIVRWIDETVGVATCAQVGKVFFPQQKSADVLTRKRMKVIADAGLVKRFKPELCGPYVYYKGRQPGIADHQLTVTEVYTRLAALPGKIATWEKEPVFGSLRPDAFCEIVRGSLHYLYCIEVERMTGNPLNQAKYESYYASGEWRKRWPMFPRVLVVTDKKVKIESTYIRFIIVPTDFKGLEGIF